MSCQTDTRTDRNCGRKFPTRRMHTNVHSRVTNHQQSRTRRHRMWMMRAINRRYREPAGCGAGNDTVPAGRPCSLPKAPRPTTNTQVHASQNHRRRVTLRGRAHPQKALPGIFHEHMSRKRYSSCSVVTKSPGSSRFMHKSTTGKVRTISSAYAYAIG